MSEYTYQLIDDEFKLDAKEPAYSQSKFSTLDWNQLLKQACICQCNLAKWNYKYQKTNLAINKVMAKLTKKAKDLSDHPFHTMDKPDLIKIKDDTEDKFKNTEYYELLKEVDNIEHQIDIFKARYEELEKICRTWL